MFFPTRLIGATALLSGFAAAFPHPDSAIGNEVPVSAPNGTPVSATGSGSAWASQTLTTQATPAPTYGSGSSSWGSPNYNNCVQQCVASFGNPSATNAPPTSTTGSVSASSSSGSPASGATHTVIVAPTQGVLRFVPFALNASVGDTILFNWGANNHTVTKSSSISPCNKTSDAFFTSGTQNKDFVFTQVVNDTNPVFFHCGTPTHCQKGMFGIINPPNALGSSTSASSMMTPLAANDSTFASYVNYTNSKTAGNAKAAGWGGGVDMSSLPTWARSFAAENIMYTRTFLAANTEVLQGDGSMNLAGSTPLIFPQDLSAAVNSTSNGTLPSGSASSSAAISTSSSKILLGLVVGFSTYMMF